MSFESMEKEYVCMKKIEELSKEISDISFMAMFCTLFDIRFGAESVEKAASCLDAMCEMNRQLGAFES